MVTGMARPTLRNVDGGMRYSVARAPVFIFCNSGFPDRRSRKTEGKLAANWSEQVCKEFPTAAQRAQAQLDQQPSLAVRFLLCITGAVGAMIGGIVSPGCWSIVCEPDGAPARPRRA